MLRVSWLVWSCFCWYQHELGTFRKFQPVLCWSRILLSEQLSNQEVIFSNREKVIFVAGLKSFCFFALCLKGGSIVRLFHKEIEAYLTAEGVHNDQLIENGIYSSKNFFMLFSNPFLVRVDAQFSLKRGSDRKKKLILSSGAKSCTWLPSHSDRLQESHRKNTACIAQLWSDLGMHSLALCWHLQAALAYLFFFVISVHLRERPFDQSRPKSMFPSTASITYWQVEHEDSVLNGTWITTQDSCTEKISPGVESEELRDSFCWETNTTHWGTLRQFFRLASCLCFCSQQVYHIKSWQTAAINPETWSQKNVVFILREFGLMSACFLMPISDLICLTRLQGTCSGGTSSCGCDTWTQNCTWVWNLTEPSPWPRMDAARTASSSCTLSSRWVQTWNQNWRMPPVFRLNWFPISLFVGA